MDHMTRLAPVVIAFAIALASLTGSAEARTRAGISAPSGLRVSVFASGLYEPTALAFGPDHRLYVAQENGDIYVQTRHGMDEVASGFAVILGLAWHDRKLYVSSTGEVATLSPSNHFQSWSEHVIVSGLPTGRHQNDGIVFRGKWMYLGLGSTCNACSETDARSATILRYRDNGTQGEVYARGLRNPFGLAIRPATGAIYATDNGRDDFGNSVPDELNLIAHGANYGWPGCWGYHKGSKCAHTRQPAAVFPPHCSADGIAFDSGNGLGAKYRGDAFVAEYGDTINDLDTGHIVQLVHFGKRVTVHTFATGFENPLAVAMSPNHSLLVGDFGTGIIWRFHRAD